MYGSIRGKGGFLHSISKMNWFAWEDNEAAVDLNTPVLSTAE
jgi:hypothetical protein